MGWSGTSSVETSTGAQGTDRHVAGGCLSSRHPPGRVGRLSCDSEGQQAGRCVSSRESHSSEEGVLRDPLPQAGKGGGELAPWPLSCSRCKHSPPRRPLPGYKSV